MDQRGFEPLTSIDWGGRVRSRSVVIQESSGKFSIVSISFLMGLEYLLVGWRKLNPSIVYQ